MTFYQRFEKLCAEREIKPQSKEMQKITGVSSPAISDWNLKGTLPKAQTLCNIAKYFNVTVDYLLGLSELRNFKIPVLSEEEQLLLNAYRETTIEGRFRIIQVCMNERDILEKRKLVNV